MAFPVISAQEDLIVSAAEEAADQKDYKVTLGINPETWFLHEASIHNTVTPFCVVAVYFVDHRDKWHRLLDGMHTFSCVPLVTNVKFSGKKLGFMMSRGLKENDVMRVSYTVERVIV